MPNPNMTYEELRKKLTKLYQDMDIEFGSAQQRAYSQSAYNEAASKIRDRYADKAIQLFATLCAEVIGKKYTESQMADFGIYSRAKATAINSTKDYQLMKLAQLTTKNTEEENV